MSWRNHIAEIAEGLVQAAQYPAAVLLTSGGGMLDSITTTKKAIAALLSAAALGGSVALAAVGLLGGVFDAPQDIAELRDYTEETRSQVVQTRDDLNGLVSRLDLLICELREDRTGTMPANCPGILR